MKFIFGFQKNSLPLTPPLTKKIIKAFQHLMYVTNAMENLTLKRIMLNIIHKMDLKL